MRVVMGEINFTSARSNTLHYDINWITFSEELYFYKQKLTECMEEFLQNTEIPAEFNNFFNQKREMALRLPPGNSEQLWTLELISPLFSQDGTLHYGCLGHSSVKLLSWEYSTSWLSSIMVKKHKTNSKSKHRKTCISAFPLSKLDS